MTTASGSSRFVLPLMYMRNAPASMYDVRSATNGVVKGFVGLVDHDARQPTIYLVPGIPTVLVWEGLM